MSRQDASKDTGPIIGIDLGTTNSEAAVFMEGKVQVIGPPGHLQLPSLVGLTPGGELLVGEAARNQEMLYPERTVRSIKRRMGQREEVALGERTFSPQEISSLILRELRGRAARALGRPVSRAVITVPAYFTDAQRAATREAGVLAGLEVARILNEPTAASLAYGFGDGDGRPKTLLIYDLGGGTFDVSVVSQGGDVTEVLASHGDPRLGGDDFDALILARLTARFREEHGVDLEQEEHAAALARLRRAAEEAKRTLSAEPFATVREEALASAEGRPLHLELELSREDYEEQIRPLLESTMESVFTCLERAGKAPDDLDGTLLVGGSSRTPLVSTLLQERLGARPRQDLHPDLCVALGAGVLASRLAGEESGQVLLDISPYSFGTSYLGELHGAPYRHCYKPIIHRGTPLPVTRAELFYTCRPFQTRVDVEVYQGEDPDALRNIQVGRFTIDGLTPSEDLIEVLNRMHLDLDGILRVEAIEKATRLSREITIEGALAARSARELAAAREALRDLYDSVPGEEEDGALMWDAPEDLADGARGEGAVISLFRGDPAAGGREGEGEGEEAPGGAGAAAPGATPARAKAEALLERCRGALDRMNDEDREDAIELNERIVSALDAGAGEDLAAAAGELEDLLFFIEGR